jgi:hypothetical protein
MKAACCWTCKIRHVKCDGAPTACLQCTSREVQCHGYGPVPSWMDGGPNETQEKQRIKQAVKKNFRQKKRLQARRQRDINQDASQGETESLPGVAEEGIQLRNTSQGKCLPGGLIVLTHLVSKCQFWDHAVANFDSSILANPGPIRTVIRRAPALRRSQSSDALSRSRLSLPVPIF